jgi:hypothetical protein
LTNNTVKANREQRMSLIMVSIKVHNNQHSPREGKCEGDIPVN